MLPPSDAPRPSVSGRRVLVTGASGCLGRPIVARLAARGYEVHAVTHRSTLAPAPGVTSWHADLLDPEEACAVARQVRADGLLHLAWVVTPGRWPMALENLDWVKSSMSLVRAFQHAGGTRLLVAGSCLEYDRRFGFCSESRTPCAPNTVYGAAKHALRLLIESETPGLRLAWARLFSLYGPYEHPDRLVPSVIRALLEGRRAACSHGRQIRDYLYTGAAAEALVGLFESSLTGPVNVGSGRAVTVRQLASRVAALLGDPDAIDFAALPPAASETDLPLVLADTVRLQTELGWRPPSSLDEGLIETIQWWRTAQRDAYEPAR